MIGNGSIGSEITQRGPGWVGGETRSVLNKRGNLDSAATWITSANVLFRDLDDREFNRGRPVGRYVAIKEIAMFQRLIGRAKCMIGIHRRSRRHTVFKGRGADTSICRYCRKSMRSTPAGWVVEHSS
jgi:hypothetical protein